MRIKTLKKIKRSYWITLFIGVSAAYFIWLTWKKLTIFFGNSTTVWLITGAIVLLGLLIGNLSFRKLAKRFT